MYRLQFVWLKLANSHQFSWSNRFLVASLLRYLADFGATSWQHYLLKGQLRRKVRHFIIWVVALELNNGPQSVFTFLLSSVKDLLYFEMMSLFINLVYWLFRICFNMQTILDCITEHFNIVKKESSRFRFSPKSICSPWL